MIVNRRGASRLRIGGLTPLTTIDYPGELAAVIYCQGCPWRCRYCHNGHLLGAQTRQPLIHWSEIHAFLEQRQGLLDAVVFSGGEPTLQGALPSALAIVRSQGFKIGMHSGGAYPKRLARVLDQIDWVGFDIKGLPEDYHHLTGVANAGSRAWKSLETLLTTQLDYEVRTTIAPYHTPAQITGLAHQLARLGVRHYRLQDCDRAHALDPDLQTNPYSLAELAQDIDRKAFETLLLR